MCGCTALANITLIYCCILVGGAEAENSTEEMPKRSNGESTDERQTDTLEIDAALLFLVYAIVFRPLNIIIYVGSTARTDKFERSDEHFRLRGGARRVTITFAQAWFQPIINFFEFRELWRGECTTAQAKGIEQFFMDKHETKVSRPRSRESCVAHDVDLMTKGSIPRQLNIVNACTDDSMVEWAASRVAHDSAITLHLSPMEQARTNYTFEIQRIAFETEAAALSSRVISDCIDKYTTIQSNTRVKVSDFYTDLVRINGSLSVDDGLDVRRCCRSKLLAFNTDHHAGETLSAESVVAELRSIQTSFGMHLPSTTQPMTNIPAKSNDTERDWSGYEKRLQTNRASKVFPPFTSTNESPYFRRCNWANDPAAMPPEYIHIAKVIDSIVDVSIDELMDEKSINYKSMTAVGMVTRGVRKGGEHPHYTINWPFDRHHIIAYLISAGGLVADSSRIVWGEKEVMFVASSYESKLWERDEYIDGKIAKSMLTNENGVYKATRGASIFSFPSKRTSNDISGGSSDARVVLKGDVMFHFRPSVVMVRVPRTTKHLDYVPRPIYTDVHNPWKTFCVTMMYKTWDEQRINGLIAERNQPHPPATEKEYECLVEPSKLCTAFDTPKTRDEFFLLCTQVDIELVTLLLSWMCSDCEFPWHRHNSLSYLRQKCAAKCTKDTFRVLSHVYDLEHGGHTTEVHVSDIGDETCDDDESECDSDHFEP